MRSEVRIEERRMDLKRLATCIGLIPGHNERSGISYVRAGSPARMTGADSATYRALRLCCVAIEGFYRTPSLQGGKYIETMIQGNFLLNLGFAHEIKNHARGFGREPI